MKYSLSCDTCGRGNQFVPIIEKPKRLGYEGKITNLNQKNTDGREVDNICMDCLNDEIEHLI